MNFKYLKGFIVLSIAVRNSISTLTEIWWFLLTLQDSLPACNRYRSETYYLLLNLLIVNYPMGYFWSHRYSGRLLIVDIGWLFHDFSSSTWSFAFGSKTTFDQTCWGSKSIWGWIGLWRNLTTCTYLEHSPSVSGIEDCFWCLFGTPGGLREQLKYILRPAYLNG